MQTLALPATGIRLLCIGAHPDDIEIGAGGTIAGLAADGRLASVHWMVLTGSDERATEARLGAATFLEGGPEPQLTLRSFRDGFLPSEHADVKATFESIKGDVRPDLILTHRREDLHQDHRVAAELTWNTFRDHLVLEYEIAKYEGDLGNPNVYVPLPAGGIERKIERLLTVFASQHGRDWFDPETFRGLARIRGMECRAESGYAEAFTGRKLVL